MSSKPPNENEMLIHIQAALAMADMEQMVLVASKCNPHAFARTMAIFYFGIMLAGATSDIEIEIPEGMDYHQYAVNTAFVNAAIQYGVILIENFTDDHVDPNDDPPLADAWFNWGEGRDDVK